MTLTMTDQTAVNELLGMTDAEFNKVVEQDIRGGADQAYAGALRTPEVVTRWHNHLIRIRTSVEGQMRSRELRLEHDKLKARLVGVRASEREITKIEADYTDWLRRISTFYRGVCESVTEARQYLMQARPDVESLLASLEAYDKLLERQNEVFKVVQRHRDNFPSDDEPSDDDEALWALLDPPGNPE